MLLLSTILMLCATALPLSVLAFPAHSIPVTSNTTSAAVSGPCGDDWIFVFMYTEPEFQGTWHAACVAPGTCHNVRSDINDDMSSVGIVGPTAKEYCQLYE